MVTQLRFYIENAEQESVIQNYISFFSSIKNAIEEKRFSTEESISIFENYIFSDIMSVYFEKKSPPFGSYEDWDAWAFHHKKPFWGNPWLDLLANESDNSLYLGVRCFEGENENVVYIPRIYFRCEKKFNELSEFWSNIEKSNSIDYWLRIEKRFVTVGLAF